MNDPSSQLIHRAHSGDRAAAGQLIDQFYQRIYAYHRRLTGDTHDAEDLTQQTFSKAWQSIAKFESRASVSSWLHGIAYHVFADWMRKRRPTENLNEDWWQSCPEPFEPFKELQKRDSAANVWSAADELPNDLRQTVHLHYYQELTLQETADALGIAVSTVKFRISKAISQLQKLLAEPGLISAVSKQ